MNILFFIPQLGCGGAEVLLKDISLELIKRGNKVKIISLCEHHYSFINFPERALFTSTVSIEVFPVSFTNPISFLRSKEVKHLQKIVDEFKPDIIHSHLFLAEIVSRSLFYPDAKWFSHCHDNMRQLKPFALKDLINKIRLKENVEKWYLYYRYSINKGNRFIAISNDAQIFFQQVLPSYLNKITLLFNSINVDRFKKPINFQKSKKHQIQLTTIGSLVNKKNQAFLLSVTKQLKLQNIDAHLNLFGDGVNRKQLESLAIKLGVENHVTFHGNHPNVASYLWQSDIYVHSATYEPFGLVLIEAMAAGLPVVCLDGGGNRDIIEQNKNGIMVYEQNAELFAEAILKIATNEALYQQMSAYAVEYASRFDIKPYTDKLLALYMS